MVPVIRRRICQLLLSALLLLGAAAACGGPPAERISPTDGKVMVRVPAGEFVMGAKADDRDAAGDEQPQHTVYLDAFWMDKTETTNAQYRRCVEAGACRPPEYSFSYTRDHYFDDPTFDHYPVIWVSWDDARAYCEWAGKRLPTEAEWEKASRGPQARRYPWGEEPPDGRLANLCDANCPFDYRHPDIDDKYADTAPVGSYPAGASPYGLLDMAGNVWEWVADWYAADYYTWTAQRNPSGPAYGTERVMRGGAWNMWQKDIRTAAREKGAPGHTYANVGIRCAQDD
jgi:formylglycine-generating enzyme required for sulfatase activity